MENKYNIFIDNIASFISNMDRRKFFELYQKAGGREGGGIRMWNTWLLAGDFFSFWKELSPAEKDIIVKAITLI